MSIRTFIFCDGCNPQGIRNIYDENHHNRRNIDGRSWYEGTLETAAKYGWQVNKEGIILCPHCIDNGVANLLTEDQALSKELKLNSKQSEHTQ